jgi:hypothetical protein
MNANTQQETTALSVIERAAVALGSSKAATELTALVEQSKSITAITNKDGRTECHAAAMRAMTARTDIEKAGKAARDDATKFSKAVIAEEARLVSIIEPEEKRLKALRDAWDEKIAAEKAEAERIERERIAAIVLRITKIKECPITVATGTSVDVAWLISDLNAMDIGADFGELMGEATDARIEAIATLTAMRDAKTRAEEEAARIKREQEAEAERLRLEREEQAAAAKAERERLSAERAELDRQRAEQDAAKREADRLESVRLERQRTELAAQQKALDDQRAEQARRESAIRAAEEAAAAKLKAEQEEAERQRKASEEAAAKIERDLLTDANQTRYEEPAPQTAPSPSSARLDETVASAAQRNGMTGSARLLDRLDDLARRMTEAELSDLCIHAAHILENRRAAA